METKKRAALPAQILLHSTFGLALGVSMCVCLGLAAPVWGLLLGAGFALAGIAEEKGRLAPAYLAFSLLLFTYTRFGMRTAQLALLIGAALLFAARFFFDRLLPLLRTAAMTGLQFATVLTVTVMQTNIYFGIGASGATVREMLHSYRSLGFHPNWRGILYGTIVMVVMITVPRKFKRFGKVCSAALLGLLIAWALNLWLVPAGLPQVFAELGALSRPLTAAKDLFLQPGMPLRPLHAALSGCGFCLAQLLSAAALPAQQKAALTGGAALSAAGAPALLPIPPVPPLKRGRVIAALLLLGLAAVSAFTGFGVFGRLPAAACGVMLIVGAWQSVEWGKLKAAFAAPDTMTPFLITVLLVLLQGIGFGCVSAAALAITERLLRLTHEKERS